MIHGSRQPGLGYAWYVVLVLMACYTLSFVDRQILSLLVGPIKRDLMVSDTRVGLLQGLAFSLFYTLMGLPLGRLADTRNRRNFIAVAVVVWSFFTAACSIAKSFWSLFATRMGVGIGEAGLSPAAYSLITDYFPKERLGLALSVYSMGLFIGSGLALLVGGATVDALSHLAPITLPWIGAMASWRLTFLIVGAPGLLFALLVYTIREPLRGNVLRTAEGRPSHLTLRETLDQVRPRWQSMLGISLGMVFQSTITYGFQAWTPTYFVRVHDWTPGQAGRALGTIILISGCLGMYVGGALCDRWQRQGMFEAPLMVAIPSAIGAGILFPLALSVHNPQTTLMLLFPAVFFQALPVATVVAAIQLIFPNQLRGQMSALFLFCLNLGGLTLGPLLPAVFNDYVFKNEKMVGPSLALTIGIAALLTLIVFLSTFRPYRRHYQLMQSLESKVGV